MSDFPPEGLPEWSDDELALWKSARDDRPPSRSLAATLQAVGVGGAITTAASGAGAGVVAKAGIGTMVFKWGAVVGLASAVAVGGGLMARRSNAPAHPPAPAADSKLEAPRPVVPAGTEATPPAPPVTPAPASTVRPATAPARASSPASQPDITREIESIDSARALIREGRTKEALAALDRYGAEQGKGKTLGVEATVLRIEALVRQGDRARANALASSFLAAHPKSPYASRIRTLLSSSTRSAPSAGKESGNAP
jgi:hypothetical protein